MSSGFLALNIGRSALMAQQIALDTTGHNLANVSTEGYSRQRVSITSAVSVDSDKGSFGTGVNLDKVSRVHEIFLERQLSRVTTQNSYDTQMAMGLTELQAVINEPGEHSISTAMTEFWNSWEALSMRPTDAGLRAQVLEAANNLATEYNTKIAGLFTSETGFNDEIRNLVNSVNQYAGQLAQLNNAVLTAELSGQPANDLRDKRDELVRKISELIGVEPKEENGSLNLRFPDGGPYLVAGSNAFGLSVSEDLDGRVTGINLEVHPLAINTGRIGAYLELRDKVSPELRTELADMMARVTDRVNALHTSGYDLSGNEGELMFKWVGAAERAITYPSSGLYDVRVGTGLESGTHTLSVVSVDQASGAGLVPNTFGTLSSGGITLTHVSGDYTGDNVLNLDYHVRILDANTSAGSLSGMRIQVYKGDEEVGNPINLTSAGLTDNVSLTVDGMNLNIAVDLGSPTAKFVAGERSDGLSTTGYVSLDGGVGVHVDHVAQTSYDMANGNSDGYRPGGMAKVVFELKSGFSGSTFTVNSASAKLAVNTVLLGSTDKIAAALPRSPGEAPSQGDGELARLIGDLATERMFELTGETASGRMGRIVQNLGEQTRQAEVYQRADNAILQQLVSQKQSFSGVNLDEEMVLMIQFQRGFEASARFVSAADQILDTIINRLGRVGL